MLGDGTIRAPHVFFCAYKPQYGIKYGQYRLRPAWKPWMEKVGDHSGESLRRLWFIQNAFCGGILKYPAGGQIELPGGVVKDNQDYSREIVEKMQAGAVYALPSGVDEQGHPLWDFIPARINGQAKELLD